MTNVGFMKRMHAYKAAFDAGKADDISMGTFNYPILMAADILLYDAHYVPVGKDQKQHVEYARDIAQKFNHKFGVSFVLPEPKIRAHVATVPGIDGRKMSKSYNNYIGLFEEEAVIRKKVMRIPTDALPIEAPKDPDTCNVYAISKLFL
jgi:tryptophanyl-tRNA synthetase